MTLRVGEKGTTQTNIPVDNTISVRKELLIEAACVIGKVRPDFLDMEPQVLHLTAQFQDSTGAELTSRKIHFLSIPE